MLMNPWICDDPPVLAIVMETLNVIRSQCLNKINPSLKKANEFFHSVGQQIIVILLLFLDFLEEPLYDTVLWLPF